MAHAEIAAYAEQQIGSCVRNACLVESGIQALDFGGNGDVRPDAGHGSEFDVCKGRGNTMLIQGYQDGTGKKSVIIDKRTLGRFEIPRGCLAGDGSIQLADRLGKIRSVRHHCTLCNGEVHHGHENDKDHEDGSAFFMVDCKEKN
jgi:hypothetical protein